MKSIFHCVAIGFAVVALSGPAFAQPTIPLPADKKFPGPVLPQNIGVITGNIEMFDTPQGGCTSLTGIPRLFDNGAEVPTPSLLLSRVSTGNPLSTGYAYTIKGRLPGDHTISVVMDGGCAGFAWRPASRRISLERPAMKSEGQNFVYERVRVKIEPVEPFTLPRPKLPRR